MKKLLYVLLLGCINTNCSYVVRPNCHKIIYIKNNTDKTVFFTKESTIDNCTFTILELKPFATDSNLLARTKYSDRCFEEKFLNGSFRLTMTYYKEDPLPFRYPKCDYDKLKSMVAEERVITLEYLQKNNWTVTYPK
jgi:hypothetical protein